MKCMFKQALNLVVCLYQDIPEFMEFFNLAKKLKPAEFAKLIELILLIGEDEVDRILTEGSQGKLEHFVGLINAGHALIKSKIEEEG